MRKGRKAAWCIPMVSLLTAFALPLWSQNMRTIDSLRRISPTNPLNQFEVLNAIGFEYRFSYPDSTIFYCTKAFELGQRNHLNKGLSRPLSFIGLAKVNQGNYKEALEFHNRSIAIATEQQDSFQLAHGYNNVGRLFYEKGDLVRAYNYFVSARELFEKAGDRSGLAYVYRSLADVFKAKEDYIKALENSKRALALRTELGDLRSITSAHMELGLLYDQMDSASHAIKQFEKADSIASEIKDKMTKAEISVGMAELLCRSGKSEQAGSIAQEVLRVVTENTNQKIFLRARVLLARCNIFWSKYPTARNILEQVYTSSGKAGNLEIQRTAARLLGKVYTSMNNAEKAKNFTDIYALLDAKIRNEDLNKEIDRLQFQLQIERTEKENEALKARQLQDESLITRQAQQNWLLIVIASFVGLMAVSAWRTSRKRKVVNRRLEEQNQYILRQREEIYKQNDVLYRSNKELDTLNHEKDTVMNIVAHDLKAPMNRIFGLTHILEKDGTLTDKQIELVRLVKECTRGGLDLITGLLDVHALNELREPPKPQSLSFEQFLNSKTRAFFPVAEAKGSAVECVCTFSHPVVTEASYVARILDNLLSNAIKFSPRNSTISISASWSEGHICISVKDQGPGFTPEDKTKLFQKFRKLSAQPTAGESSNGLGLAIVKILVDRLDGTIDLRSTPRGSEFVIRIPATKG